MKFLAVDFGTKRCGLAWCDSSLGVVLPFGVVKNTSQLLILIKAEKPDTLVVGFPLGLDGHENKNTERIKKLVFELTKTLTIPVVLHDERFSSGAADAMGEGVSRDEKAAMVILEGYLENAKVKAKRI